MKPSVHNQGDRHPCTSGIDQHTKTIDAAAAAWLAGDEQRCDRELLEPMRTPEYQQLFERIFLQRNVTMTRAIESLLEQKARIRDSGSRARDR